MSGICGFVSKRGEFRHSASAIEGMCRLLSVGGTAPDPASVSTVSVGPASLGVTAPGRHIGGIAQTKRDDAAIALALCGSVFDTGREASAEPGAAPAAAFLDSYLTEGMAFVKRIGGEVSLAIWDGRTESMYLVTDPFRIHLLYYSDRPDQFVFSSRIGAMFASPIPFASDLLPRAIVDVVGNSIIPTPHTAFREVFKVPPGHIVEHRRDGTSLTPYWQIDFRHPSRKRETDLAQELRGRFTDAIARRLRIDGPPERLGSFLSGGVDSSTVTAVLQQVAGCRMKSFSIGFGEARYNEITYARIVARRLGVEHFEYYVSPRDVSSVLPTLLASFDEPYGNASAIPTYFCSRLARDHGVDVLYGGDGGDELFAGNERYATQELFEMYSRVPRWLRRGLIEPTVTTLADWLRLAPAIKGRKYIQRALLPPAKRLTSYDFLRMTPIARLFTDDFLDQVGRDYDPGAALEALHHQAPAQTELDRQLYIDLHLAISDNDLIKVTRMTEAAAVTVHFPFLDRALAEFAMTVPASIKMRGRRLRTFFKAAYADVLPPEVRSKRKHGFGLPIADWLRTDPQLAAVLDDVLFGARARARGYFRREALEELRRLYHSDATSFYGAVLWNLVMLELWHRGVEEAGRNHTTASAT